MTTGIHVVRDLFCVSCSTILGWRYELAHEDREKYKEGKYILERIQLVDLDAAPGGAFTAPGAEHPAAATAAIAAGSPSGSPGAAYGNGQAHGFMPPRHLYQATPLRPVRASDPEELRAFFASWVPTGPVALPPPYNLDLCKFIIYNAVLLNTAVT